MGGMGGGGFRGGGFRGGGFGFRGGFNRGFGFNNFGRFNNGFGGWGWGGWGWGWPVAFWGGPWDWGWDTGWGPDYGYGGYGGYASPAYAMTPSYGGGGFPSSPVNIVYAPQGPIYTERANPVMHEYNYDEYGQPTGGGGGGGGSAVASSPIFLLAFQNDHAIRAAASYWVTGQTLHYVTLQREEKQVPLSSLDRALTLQLNRERRVPFQLP